jgi:polyisoprenoid-binding protein YceI
MKKIGILVLAVAFATMSFVAPKNNIEEVYKVDVNNSKITWKGYKPTGSHVGTIKLQSGEIEMLGDKLKGGTFIANMSTIKDDDGSEKLEAHLKSEDFFEVEVYKTAQFEITKVHYHDGGIHVTGNLTMKDITKEITFGATIFADKEAVTFKSETIKVNRAKYNIKYKSQSFFDDLKDKFIDDEFDLQVSIVAKK